MKLKIALSNCTKKNQFISSADTYIANVVTWHGELISTNKTVQYVA